MPVVPWIDIDAVLPLRKDAVLPLRKKQQVGTEEGVDWRARSRLAIDPTTGGTGVRRRAFVITLRVHQRLEGQHQRRSAMTFSPGSLAVERFLHRFTRRSLAPIPTDGLLAAKMRIDTVIDERTRQFSLFEETPELVLIPPAPSHGPPAFPQSQVADVLSPSQVRSFLDCSARWWYKYGLSLPDPKGSSLVRGIVVHRMAETFLRAKYSGASPVVEDLAGIFDQLWDETAAEGSFQPNEDLDKLKVQTAQLARMYLDEVAPEIEPAVIDGRPAMEQCSPKRGKQAFTDRRFPGPKTIVLGPVSFRFIELAGSGLFGGLARARQAPEPTPLNATDSAQRPRRQNREPRALVDQSIQTGWARHLRRRRAGPRKPNRLTWHPSSHSHATQCDGLRGASEAPKPR